MQINAAVPWRSLWAGAGTTTSFTDEGAGGGFQERSTNSLPIGHQRRGSGDHGGIQVPGLYHLLQVGLVPKRRSETSSQYFMKQLKCPKLLNCCIGQQLNEWGHSPASVTSAASKNRTTPGHQDSLQVEWQTCPGFPGTLQGESN